MQIVIAAFTARDGQSAVAGIHHEEYVFGRNRFRDVLKIGHRNRLAFEIARVSVPGNDVAEIAPARQAPRRSMTGEEYEHAIFALHVIGIGKSVSQSGKDP